MKKILVSDIDNTVADQAARIKKFYNFQNNKYDPSGNSLVAIKNDKVLAGSVESMQALSEHYSIHWLSARPENQYDATKYWLEKNNFPIDSLTLVDNHENKIPELKRLTPDVYIDDMRYDYLSFKPKLATRFIKLVQKTGINFIIFDGNWTKATEEILSQI